VAVFGNELNFNRNKKTAFCRLQYLVLSCFCENQERVENS